MAERAANRSRLGALLRGLRRSERGFTLIEILVAATLAAVGIIALITVFDSSRNLVTLAERQESASHQAQREIERILALDYNQVALTSNPTHNPNTAHPDHYVNGAEYQWDQGSTGPKSEPLVPASAGGGVGGPSATWNDGQNRVSGSVHRYITWVDDPCCTGSEDAKRVTVAVTVDGAGGPRKPVLASTIVIDPTKS